MLREEIAMVYICYYYVRIGGPGYKLDVSYESFSKS